MFYFQLFNHKYSRRALFNVFNQFELDDLSEMNEFDNHIEHSEIFDNNLYGRVRAKPISVEEQAINNIQLTYDKFVEIMNYLRLSDFQEIRFSGGEPLCNIDTIRMIEWVNEHTEWEVGLATNASLITEELAERLGKTRVMLTVHLPGIANEEYFNVTKVNDQKDFFNNISFMDIYNKVFLEEYFPKQVRTVLTYLCTYNEFLPQGAPTSSYISNLIMQGFDEEIGSFCEKNNISYTRYSDDMTFSGNFNVKMVIFKVKDELKKMGMQLNYDKIHVIYNNMSQQVTGITVNEKPQVLKVKRRKIRQEVYYIKKYGLYSHLKRINVKDEFSYLRSLLGKINFVLMVNSEDLEFFKYREFILKIFNNL